MSRAGKEKIYREEQEEQGEQEFSQRSRSRSRSRSRDKRERNQSSQDEQEYQYDDDEKQSLQNSQSHKRNNEITPESVAVELRSKILDFFGAVNRDKGFVFTPAQRQKLNKQQARLAKKNKQHKKIEWSKQCQWKLQEQTSKIEQLFGESYPGLDPLSLKLMKGVFLKTSYLFGRETTSQLYQILLNILNIILNKQQDSLQRVREFMSYLLDDNKQFFFFNFKFSNNFKLTSNDTKEKMTIEEAYHTFGEEIYQELKKALMM